MKHISTILLVVLLAAVGVLYFLHFNNGKPGSAPVAKKSGATGDSGLQVPKGNIAYIEIDSLHENYTYYKALKDELERKQKAAMNELEEKQRRFQSRAAQLQQQAQSMTPQQQEAAGQEINNMQQEFEKRKQQLDNDLFTLTNNMKKTVLNRVQDFLAEYNKNRRYDYILSYEPGFMFYKDSTLNITSDVVNGLNEMEKKKKQ
jgi:outer membrane protein